MRTFRRPLFWTSVLGETALAAQVSAALHINSSCEGYLFMSLYDVQHCNVVFLHGSQVKGHAS